MDDPMDRVVRKQLVSHLRGGEAFMPVDHMVDKVPFDMTGIVPEGLPYSFYQLFYHLRLAQYDILEFIRNPNYESPAWPDEYWPENPVPQNKQEWQQLKDFYFTERDEFAAYLADQDHDLIKLIPHGSGQTLLREALLVLEHNAYHTGQLLILLRLLGLH
ncbi:MAG: DinB family protein [Balneolales bacterium]